MRPSEDEIDDELRGHLALCIQDRIDRGEDPDAARRAALREFGYIPAIRDSVRRVWFSRSFDLIADFTQDMRVGLRSLRAARGLALTVVITMALGIGANAAIFSVVQDVLLRPLVNEDQDRLLYIRQSAPGLAQDNVTFSVPEIEDFKSRMTTIRDFGEFSVIDFPLIGLGEPRVVQAGVVNGSYFRVMGLQPSMGRLLDERDDGPRAAAAVVLTHRFWSDALGADESVLGRTVRVGTKTATIVGVLEPSVPYPAQTEIIANVVTSPHHLEATMVTGRSHRMTELFGRLSPGVTVDDARQELSAVHAVMRREHPESYSAEAGMRVTARPLREQVTAPARPVLLVLWAAAAVVFVVACANVANLILARSVRRESELAVRAALGASWWALRRTLLAESLLLCGAGALLGVVIASPLVAVVGRYAAQFYVASTAPALDAGLLWVGAVLAAIAAVAIAFVPRLPSTGPKAAFSFGGGGVRRAPRVNGRLRLFAIIQVALACALLAGAGTLQAAFLSLQSAGTGIDMRVMAIDVPLPIEAAGPELLQFFDTATTRIAALPGVQHVASGSFVPWRDAGSFGPGFRVAVPGRDGQGDADEPHARLRTVSPGYFETLGARILEGRDFTAEDRGGTEPVVIISRSLADRLFAGRKASGESLWWTDPYFGPRTPRRIVGVVADVDDEHLVPGAVLTVYHPIRQLPFANRLFVRAAGDPYALVTPITEIVRDLAVEQPVVRPATLADVRAEVLAPERLNAFVVTGFGGIALLIAVVGVTGVLSFSVAARRREFGVRLAIGASPRRLLMLVLSDAALIVGTGIVVGGLAAALMTDLLPIAGAALLFGGAAAAASLWPALRAARVNVLEALRVE